MSHQPERKEKDCLNCGVIVHGRYCHKCGQENIVTKETFWGMLHHFIEDVTHFDSKFFDTLRYVLFRPGYLSVQYMLGRRASYLNPIRMYLFTSAIFFLIFSFQDAEKLITISDADKPLTSQERQQYLKSFQEDVIKDPTDTFSLSKIAILQDSTHPITNKELFYQKSRITINGKKYDSLEEYDSLQRVLPKEKQDPWLPKIVARKTMQLSNKYNHDVKAGLIDFTEALLHRLPYLLFISLPFFALILKLLYVRRKSFYYTDHVIFTLHHYIFSFILFLVIFGISQLIDWTGWDFLKGFIIFLLICWGGYLFAAMKVFYKQGIGKTVIKFLILNALGAIVIIILFLIFILFSIFQM